MTTKNQVDQGYKKIFVAVDYLEQEIDPFGQALAIAKIFGSQIRVFHCVQNKEIPEVLTTEPLTNISMYAADQIQDVLEFKEQIIEHKIEELQHWLDSFCIRAADEGITADYYYQMGDAGHTIASKAKEWGSDLIVVGRRRKNALTEILLGSVSNYVLHHAHCSVLVVQP